MEPQHLLTLPIADEAAIRVNTESKNRPHSDSTFTRFELESTNSDFHFSSLDLSQAPHQDTNISIDPPRTPTGESVRFGTTGGHGRTFTLPNGDFLNICQKAISGNTIAASKIADQFSSPVHMANICGAFLTVAETGRLLRTTVQADSSTSHALHAHRYDLIRGALTTDTGFTVETREELESLINILDGIDQIGSVELIPVLGDVTTRYHGSPEQPKSLVENLGYDLETLEQKHGRLFFACYLSHLLQTRDTGHAKSYAETRSWASNKDYKQMKSRAEQADFSTRGRKWRAVLPLSAHQDDSEFSHVLANALYWTGVNVQTHSRLNEHLFNGALHVAENTGNRYIEGWARYERLNAKGHRLRAQSNYRPAKRIFTRSKRIASNYGFLPNWEPIYNTANVRGSILRSNGDYQGAIENFENALDNIVEYTIPNEKLNEIVHHLKAQQLETRAHITNFEDPGAGPNDLLDEAETHYRAIGFRRSADRVQHKLARLDRPTHTEEHTPETTSPSPGADTDSKPPQSQVQEETTDSQTQPEPTESTNPPTNSDPGEVERIKPEAPRDQFEPNPELDDSLTPIDPNESGTGDIMTSPRDRDTSQHRNMDDEW